MSSKGGSGACDAGVVGVLAGVGVKPVVSPGWGVGIDPVGGANAGTPLPRVGSVATAGAGVNGAPALGSVCASPLFEKKPSNVNRVIKLMRADGIC